MSAALAMPASGQPVLINDIDMSALMQILSRLDDDGLAALEDDLDLYHFSGVVSAPLRAIFDEVLL